MKQLTVRGFDKELGRRLREVAKARGVVADSLDHLIGSSLWR